MSGMPRSDECRCSGEDGDGGRHLFEKTWEKGAGELGESVYGLKADLRWLAAACVGEGMSWVVVAMLILPFLPGLPSFTFP